ncbi:AI-2E family transporter [Nitrosococcus wardiae]|uniref:AI-2E family transporter n=1 Tax=Nitrosococcus wardiae TaxID=1814290 RepID=A0A4P7C0V9_9GAMM|nr:AI-2E family transporter [Nitrosococcus wardiae]QBQ55249.1 AI-2E family transporter [Nitrosococcus wardiae]
MRFVRDWFQRHFANPQVAGLALLLVVGFAIVVFMGRLLAPVLASLVIAYLLEAIVGYLERRRCPRWLAVILVFMVFLVALFGDIFGLIPLLSQQAAQFFQLLPTMIARGHELLLSLPEHYPDLFSEAQVNHLVSAIHVEVAQSGQEVFSWSVASVRNLFMLAMYFVLVPLLVFFFLKDKEQLIEWCKSYLPRERKLIVQVWREVDFQIGNYVRGKCIEILIVWVVSFLTFSILGLQFPILLGLLMGLSVLIPYIGAMAITLLVAFVAYFQWGFSAEFVEVLGAAVIIQFLDGNVLVPFLFAEVVDLHPVAVIVAIVVFGGIWGFWGLFFAIPLATLIQAVLKAWPKLPPVEEQRPLLKRWGIRFLPGRQRSR